MNKKVKNSKINKKVKKYKKLFLYNLKLFLLAIAVIMIWRGIWNFLDHYFLADNFILSNISTVILGIIILFLNDNDLEELGTGE